MMESIGRVNLLYIGGAGLLGWLLDYRIFVAATSWVHYLKYIHQYYFRGATGDITRYMAWQRDVLLYKTIALLNLAYIYFWPHIDPAAWRFDCGGLDAISLGMVLLGYFVSISATQALGIDGTYFGIELGFVKANYLFVKRFPYNLIPHPMILGQVFALVGLFKSPHLHSFDLASGGGIATRWSPIGLLPGAGSGLDGWWWLVPIHVVLYLVHMVQEIFDVWKGAPWYKKTK